MYLDAVRSRRAVLVGDGEASSPTSESGRLRVGGDHVAMDER